MRKYGIQSSILTMLHMWRKNLVTKEQTKKAAEGKLDHPSLLVNLKGSDLKGYVNDDLDDFLSNLQDKKEIKEEFILSFITPKLSNEEMELVEERNKEYLKTYLDGFYGKNPDVIPEEMKKSDSTSKYVRAPCIRRTIPLTLETSQFENRSENEVPQAEKKSNYE